MAMPSTISSTIAGSRMRGKKPRTSGAAKATATTMRRSVKWISGMVLSVRSDACVTGRGRDDGDDAG
jgi:hypothetical protein